MSCNCIKKDFNVDFDVSNPSTLIMRDRSSWVEGLDYSVPEVYDLTLEFSQSGEVFTTSIATTRDTYLDYSSVFGGAGCFPDDIVCIKCTNCGLSYQRYVAILPTIDCKIDQIISRAVTPEDYKRAQDLKSKSELLKAAMKYQRVQTATEIFTILQRELKNTHCGSCRT